MGGGKLAPALFHYHMICPESFLNTAYATVESLLIWTRFLKRKAGDYDHIIFDMPSVTQTGVTPQAASHIGHYGAESA